MSTGPSVLIVDDEDFVRESLRAVLAADGWRTHLASGAPEALTVLARRQVDVIVSDLRMPAGDATLLLEHSRSSAVEVPIIVITGVGTVAEAVRAMKDGAFDFLQKPIDPEELLLLVRRAVEHRRLLHEIRSLRSTILDLRAPRVLIGSSAPMSELRGRIAQVAPTDSTVLITGESGTGKELAAEEIHRLSGLAPRPLRRVHCAALTDEALHEGVLGVGREGVTGAEAGTLVLDEVGALSLSQQTLILHFLEAGVLRRSEGPPGGEPEIRLIATTNEGLAERVEAGTFRADLFWRLNVFPIEMPPLRDHREDIPEIVEHFLSWARAQRPGPAGSGPALRPTAEALEVLGSYGWPGNVRELRNVLERATIVSGDQELDAPLMRSILESAHPTPLRSEERELHLRRNLDAAEKEIVLRALGQAQGLKKKAALLLGIDPRNLGYYLRKHGIAE